MIKFTKEDLERRRNHDLFYDIEDDDIDYLVKCQEIVERLNKRIETIKNIPKNDEDFIFTHLRKEQEDLENIRDGI